MTAPPLLTSMLALVDSPATSEVEYVVGGSALTGSTREDAAQLLAEESMTIACGRAPALDWWRTRRDGGPAQVGNKLKALESIVEVAFGLPRKLKNVDHVQGHVAELLWNRLVNERTVCRDGRQLVRAHPIKMDALEPGGDGLVVYQDSHGTLVYRLWEIKKHDAKAGISSTINTASKQLRDRGDQYLSKLAGPETLTEDLVLGDLYANMIEWWWDRSHRAGVGVSVGTSDRHAPTRPTTFGSIRTQFPEFTEASQTESIVVAVPDFPGFADRVKEIVWSGL
ncbi:MULTISPECIES: hypothetical protein [Rhodococcus]|jgi:hypothetical protein|uniref:Anti-bacteriophage protein A/HamA C-terminal domain-containing protein n=1 Tax=Rhodococcus qingshengii JCM 15477 TaxID=1303681 RepID=A0AB38RMP6_RHOSG|nr:MULTISPECIES: hypothetical protein [Rhodococcus]MDA3637536.1 hypothetical protein [Rhodococcus sp. C-2]UPU46650.1 hypothetical protein M0639_31040 [Rhodococcus qingshengii JCM 15477]